MNDKLSLGILGIIFTILIAMNGWMISLQSNKADKLEAKDRWTGAQMMEYKEAQREYKKFIEEKLNVINSKLDILLTERGVDSRGSESE